MYTKLSKIQARLEKVQSDFHSTKQIENDPISLVLAFNSPPDREVAAFIAAVFSYGNVKQIQRTLGSIFTLLGESPANLLRQSHGNDWKERIPKHFKHRFNTAIDLGCLLTWLGEALRR